MNPASIIKRIFYHNNKGSIDRPVMRKFASRLMGGAAGNYIDDNEFLPDRIIKEQD